MKRLIALVMSILIISLPFAFAEELDLVYDSNGNLLSGDGNNRTYNSLNQLVEVRNESGVLLEEFVHHPTEERILYKRVYNNDSTLKETVYYVDENYVRVVNSSGSFDFTYVMHEGQKVAQLSLDSSKLFMHDDHLGSTSVITNESGDVVENTSYSPFGEILEGGEVSRFDYEGKEFDSVVGDYDFNFRKYKPEWGLFLQPDSLLPEAYDPQKLNRYMFERGNPYKNIEVGGRYEKEFHYETTKQLALEAGFTDSQAQEVAQANQAMDEGLSAPWFSPGEHFKSRWEAEQAMVAATLDNDLEAFGEALHSYQDSYSHEGISPAEHVKLILEDENPDDWKKDIKKTAKMIEGTEYYLQRFQEYNSKDKLRNGKGGSGHGSSVRSGREMQDYWTKTWKRLNRIQKKFLRRAKQLKRERLQKVLKDRK